MSIAVGEDDEWDESDSSEDERDRRARDKSDDEEQEEEAPSYSLIEAEPDRSSESSSTADEHGDEDGSSSSEPAGEGDSAEDGSTSGEDRPEQDRVTRDESGGGEQGGQAPSGSSADAGGSSDEEILKGASKAEDAAEEVDAVDEVLALLRTLMPDEALLQKLLTLASDPTTLLRWLRAHSGPAELEQAIETSASTGVLGGTPVGYVDEDNSTPRARAEYDRIRNTPDDVPRISRNTGIDQDVIDRAKRNLFLEEHDVQLGPGRTEHGYFTPDEAIADLWQNADEGALSPDELSQFRALIAHEYVEHQLMEAGMPYRSDHPDAWDSDGSALFNPEHFGAHEVAPNAWSDRSLRHWRALGLEPPSSPILDDLSNLDEVVEAAKRGLNL